MPRPLSISMVIIPMSGALLLFPPLLVICSLYQFQLADASPQTALPFLTDDDFERAKALHSNNTDESVNQQDDLTVDDIIDDVHYGGRVRRSAVRSKNRVWPNGRVPYEMDTSFSDEGRAEIAAAVKEIEEKTCVRFVRKEEDDVDYLKLLNAVPPCRSKVGKIGGAQPVILGGYCAKKYMVLHELMHAIGFFHEHVRLDRDDHITVLEQNIIAGLETQFRKRTEDEVDDLGTPYDYGSITHYPARASSKNGQPTIRANHPLPEGVVMGQKNGLSEMDVIRIKLLYNCTYDCEDKYPACKEVLETENCDLILTKRWCRKTCGHCNIYPPPDKQPTEECRDTGRGCREQFHRCWADMGFTDGCQLTCGVCG